MDVEDQTWSAAELTTVRAIAVFDADRAERAWTPVLYFIFGCLGFVLGTLFGYLLWSLT